MMCPLNELQLTSANGGSRNAIEAHDCTHHRAGNGHSRATALAVVAQRDDETMRWDDRKYLPAYSRGREAALRER
jgi:hypothetical protein